MKVPQAQILAIFGASGDLSKRKLLPALFALFKKGLLPPNFRVLGVARTEMTTEEFREAKRGEIAKFSDDTAADQRLDDFLKILDYVHFDTANPNEYGKLKDTLYSLAKANSCPNNFLFYMGTPPQMFEPITEGLKLSGLNEPDGGWRRVVVEKPFGTDLKSALELNATLLTAFKEDEIYRIDHYLGKETVQNILVLRFANGIFEPLWNRNYIESVEITATETVGVENRGSYYEHAGAMRDMVQNHLLHLMAFIAMECPASLDSESMRDETVKVFRSLRPISEEEMHSSVFRGQYAAGEVDGKAVPGYLAEKGVSADSLTETYVAMRFFIDNWRWQDVPFFVYTGKRLHKKRSEIVVNFKSAPKKLFDGQCGGSSCNKLTLRIQPDESISLKFGLKIPGEGFHVAQVGMDFKYSSLADVKLPGAYERLLLDAMAGDSTLFSRSDALEYSWRFIDPIMKHWKRNGYSSILRYAAGSEGPDEAISMARSYRGITCRLPTLEGDD